MEITQYFLFACSFLFGGIMFGFTNDLSNPKFFKRCLRAALISFGLGIILELTNVADSKVGMALLIMSIPGIYLGYYVVLRKIFGIWKGTDPYAPGTVDAMGAPPIGGVWTTYPKERKVIWTDYLFNFAMLVIPLFTIIGIAYLINHI